MKIEKYDGSVSSMAGLSGRQWRIIAWSVVILIGFIVMLHELATFY